MRIGMKRFQDFNRLLYGETTGRINGRQLYKALTPEEYGTLLSLLLHEKVRLRWLAAARLGKIGDERAVDPLINALQDSHWLVRLHAAKALGRLKSQKGIKPLVGLLNDNNAYVRRRVVSSISQLNTNKDDYVIEVLISALNDSDRVVRARSAWVLGNFVSSTSIRAIAVAVLDPDLNVSWRAIDSLQKIGAAAVPALVGLLEAHDSEVRYRAVKTLGKIRDVRAVQPLENMLNDPVQKVRQRAKYAIHQIKHPLFKYQPSQTPKPILEMARNMWNKLWKRS